MTSELSDHDPPLRLLSSISKAPLLPEALIDHRPDSRSPNTDVSAAELDVLRCLSHGLNFRMTADLLDRSIHTVKNQSRGARFALRAKTTSHAVAIALRRKLID